MESAQVCGTGFAQGGTESMKWKESHHAGAILQKIEKYLIQKQSLKSSHSLVSNHH
jgi:hypothetical protein